MTRSDKGEDRFDYKVKWILSTAMAMTVFYTILWAFFPRIEVIEKKPICPSIIPELVCGPPKIVEKYIVSDCNTHTK